MCGFTLGSEIKEASRSSDPIGQEHNYEPKEVTVGLGPKYE